jgi:hypothetical protein
MCVDACHVDICVDARIVIMSVIRCHVNRCVIVCHVDMCVDACIFAVYVFLRVTLMCS